MSYHLIGLIDAHDQAQQACEKIKASKTGIEKLCTSDMLRAVFNVPTTTLDNERAEAQTALQAAMATSLRA